MLNRSVGLAAGLSVEAEPNEHLSAFPVNTSRRIGASSQAEELVQLSRLMDTLVIAALFAWTWKPEFRDFRFESVASLLVVPSWMFLLRYFGLYESHRIEGFSALARRFLSAQVLGGLIGVPVALWAEGFSGLSRAGLFLLVSTAAILALKALMMAVLTWSRRHGVDQRYVCVVGGWDVAEKISREFVQHPQWGLHVAFAGIGFSAREFYSYPERRFLGNDLEQVIRTEVIDEVLIAVPAERLGQERALFALCKQYGLLGRVLPLASVPEIRDANLSDFHGAVTIGVGGLPHNRQAMALKRGLDVVLAACLLVIATPLILAAAALVKLSSGGPVFFVQTRIGLRGRKFRMYKLRTMIDGAETMARSRTLANSPIFKDPHDWRITPIGHVLRRFSIDELPQLWNVILGDMSLVGPRPLPPQEATAISGTHRKRFSVRPGITGLWQVSGRSDVDYNGWIHYDVGYVNKWSLWLDAKVLLQTVPAVLRGRGAY